MKAIIAPLNEYLYNYQKYDGLTYFDRLKKNEPRFFTKLKELQERNKIIRVIYLAFAFIIILPFFALPLFIYFILRSIVPSIYRQLYNLEFKHFFKTINKNSLKEVESVFFARRKNIKREISYYQEEGLNLFLYFNPKLIPKRAKKRKAFFEKLELIKKELGVVHVFEAMSSSDIEKTISEFEINISESFFIGDGNFDVSVVFSQRKPIKN